MTDHLIRCADLWAGYGGEPVLRGVNLAVAPGTLLPIVGPNGGGKTTLLRALLGLVRPLAGRVETPFARRRPGYVPQQRTLDPDYPAAVRDIVALGLYGRTGWWRPGGPDGRTAVAAVLAACGLEAHARKHFGELSEGLRQRTLLARALVGEPDVLLLDEPAAGLDHASATELLGRLRGLAAAGRTVLLVHHELHHLPRLAAEVCLVADGGAARLPVAEAVAVLGGAPGGRR